MNNDTISRQETLEHLRKRLIETAFNNVGYECDAGKVFEDASKRLDVWLSEVPSAHPEQDILSWLLAYHTKSFDLHGRYMAHEVIGWLVHDFANAYMAEGREG